MGLCGIFYNGFRDILTKRRQIHINLVKSGKEAAVYDKDNVITKAW